MTYSFMLRGHTGDLRGGMGQFRSETSLFYPLTQSEIIGISSSSEVVSPQLLFATRDWMKRTAASGKAPLCFSPPAGSAAFSL